MSRTALHDGPINLGDEVSDTVTEFQGVVVAITTWLNGCRRMIVQPRKLEEKGRMPSTEQFDETQLRVVTRSVVAAPNAPRVDAAEPAVTERRTGGPRPAPTQSPAPSRF